MRHGPRSSWLNTFSINYFKIYFYLVRSKVCRLSQILETKTWKMGQNGNLITKYNKVDFNFLKNVFLYSQS